MRALALLALVAFAAHAQPPPPSPVPSPTSPTPPTGATVAVDADGTGLDIQASDRGNVLHNQYGTWNFDSVATPNGRHIKLNGAIDNGGEGKYLIVASGGQMFAQAASDNGWWVYAQSTGWTSSSDGPKVDRTITCAPPTENTDGSALALPLAFVFYHGTSPGSLYDKSPRQATCLYKWAALGIGAHYFAATAIDAGGDESAYSNMAGSGVGWILPSPPSELAVVQKSPVYSVTISKNKIATTVAVGTVDQGVKCDPKQPVLDKFVVPRESVTWYGNVKPQVVVAYCQAPL